MGLLLSLQTSHLSCWGLCGPKGRLTLAVAAVCGGCKAYLPHFGWSWEQNSLLLSPPDVFFVVFFFLFFSASIDSRHQ